MFYESNWTQVAELELQKFQDDVMKYIFVYDYYGNTHRVVRDENSFTNFPAALLYSLTLITTIGKSSFIMHHIHFVYCKYTKYI